METTIYIGKIGIDNLLLALFGIGHIALFAVKRRSGPHYHRLGIYLYDGICFLGIAIMSDTLRIRALRSYLLFNYGNYVAFKILFLSVLTIPVYVHLGIDLYRLIKSRQHLRRE